MLGGEWDFMRQLTYKDIKEGGYESNFTRGQKLQAAMYEGCEVIMGDEHTLLLDFDDCQWMPDIEERLDMVKQFFGIVKVENWRSYSGDGWHVMVRTGKPMSIYVRLALQAILGSDWKRELLGLVENRMAKRGVAQNDPFLIRPSLKRSVEIYRERDPRNRDPLGELKELVKDDRNTCNNEKSKALL